MSGKKTHIKVNKEDFMIDRILDKVKERNEKAKKGKKK